MEDFYFSADDGNGTILCLAPLSNRAALAAGMQPDDAIGYWLFRMETKTREVLEVLARVPDERAAFSLKDRLGLA